MIPGTQEPPCALAAEHFRIESIELAEDIRRATELAFDLDGDEVADNAGGANLSIMTGYETETSTAMEELRAGLAAKLSDGRLHWVLRVETCVSGSSDYLRVSSFEAIDRDEDGVLELLETPGVVPAVGAGDRLERGFGPLPVSALIDFLDTEDTVEWLPGAAIAMELDIGAETLSGRIGAGLGEGAQVEIYRLLAEFFDYQLQVGISDYARDELDADRDGRITPDEVAEDSLGRIMASFDLNLFDERGAEPIFWPNRDKVDDRLSFAIGLSARRVEVE